MCGFNMDSNYYCPMFGGDFNNIWWRTGFVMNATNATFNCGTQSWGFGLNFPKGSCMALYNYNWNWA